MSQSIKDQPRSEAERRAANRDQDTELAKKGKVRVGMTADQCRMAWGEPDRISRTVTAHKTHEQWVYPSGNRLYFDDKVLKSINKTRSEKMAIEVPAVWVLPMPSALLQGGERGISQHHLPFFMGASSRVNRRTSFRFAKKSRTDFLT